MIAAETIRFRPISFPLPRLALSCADCGTRILDMNAQTVEAQDLGYCRVHFNLSDGTEAFISFCPSCAAKAWSPDRLLALERQCQYMWKRMAVPGTKPGWSGDHLTFHPAPRAIQSWAEVQ